METVATSANNSIAAASQAEWRSWNQSSAIASVCIVSRLVNTANEKFTLDFFPETHIDTLAQSFDWIR